MSKPNILAAIDIGSVTTYAGIADVSNRELKFLSIVKMPSKGVKKGEVTNIQSVQNLISHLVEALQQDCKYHIHTVIVSISGVSTMGFNVVGDIPLKGRPINRHHIQQSIAQTYEIAGKSEDKKIIHLLKQTFAVDNQYNIDDPKGLMGDKLSFHSHVINISNNAYYNLSQAFSHIDINIDRVVSAGFASAIAAATEEEKQHGVCVLDIGSDTTNIVMFLNGVVVHTDVIPVGGSMINNDVVYYSRVTEGDLEKINAEIDISHHYADDEYYYANSLTNKEKRIVKNELVNVIVARCEELINEVVKSISRSGYENSFPAGFVLCGGVANLKGLDILIQNQTGMPAKKRLIRIDLPNGESYEQSCFSTLYGLFISSIYASETITMTDAEKKSIMSKFKSSFTKHIKRLFS